jgi:hypothetical protein
MTGTAQFFSRAGTSILTSPYTVAPRSAVRIVPGNSTGSGIRTGSVRVSPGPNAFVIFSYRPNGVTVTEAGVPVLSPGTAFRAYVESGGAIQSGMAVANPSDSDVVVTVELSGVTGNFTIPARGQTAMFLNEIAGFANLQGVLRITAPTPVAVTALRGHVNERGEFLLTTTSPTDEAAVPAASELFFPHFAEGGGYSMQFILFGRASSGTMYFVNPSGNPTTLLFR